MNEVIKSLIVAKQEKVNELNRLYGEATGLKGAQGLKKRIRLLKLETEKEIRGLKALI